MFTLADFVRLNRRRHPERLAVSDGVDDLTHRVLSDRAWAIAEGLRSRGLQAGDRVGVLTGNSCFAIETYLGVLCAGGVYVPFNWRWATAELRHGITLTSPRFVLVEDQFAQAMDELGEVAGVSFERLDENGGYRDLHVDGADGAAEPTILPKPEDPAVVLFTGGTTGFSKGVVLSHRSAVFNAINELADLAFGAAPHQVGLSTTPLFHSASLLTVFTPHYVGGGTSILMRRFSEDEFADLVERFSVTSTFATPNMLRRLANAGAFTYPKGRSLRQIHSGAGLLKMPDKVALHELLPDVQLFFRYGLTEAGPMVTRLRSEDMLRPELDGSIGSEYTFAEVQLRDPEGKEVPDGELGEICVRGPGLMTEYFQQPDATRSAVRDGWLYTGDLAVRGEDGNFFFRDRMKDMIKSGGENVYASEIEQLLYAHPAVMECGVLGVPSVEWDEEVRAVVALRPGARASEDELRVYLREHLAGYKIPKVFAFIDSDDMPVNASGKIVKARLRAVVGW